MGNDGISIVVAVIHTYLIIFIKEAGMSPLAVGGIHESSRS